MFQLLIESKAPRRPQLGGSLASTVVHAAVVTALVVLSARAAEPAATVAIERLIFTPAVPLPVIPPPSAAAATPTMPSAGPAPKGTPPIAAMLDIVVGIPPVDLSLPLSTNDDVLPIGPPGSRRDGVTGGVGTGPSTANSVFREEQVEKPVFLAPGMTAPRYPDGLRAAGLSGAVMVEFVVDTSGRVEPGSIRQIHTDHELFSASVRSVLPRYRFIPAEAGGHRVRQLVRLPFRFDLHD